MPGAELANEISIIKPTRILLGNINEDVDVDVNLATWAGNSLLSIVELWASSVSEILIYHHFAQMWKLGSPPPLTKESTIRCPVRIVRRSFVIILTAS